MNLQTEPAPRALFLLGLPGSEGGWPALQPLLLTLKATPLTAVQCSWAPNTDCHCPFRGQRRVGWPRKQEQAACVRAGVSSPLRCV